MKRSQLPNPFELESLEPRIMLSGDLLVGMVDAIAPDQQDPLDTGPDLPPLEETTLPGEGDTPAATHAQSLDYDPSENLTDIFSGFDDEPIFDSPTESGSENRGNDDANVDDSDQDSFGRSLSELEQATLTEGMAALADLGAVIESHDLFSAPIILTDGLSLGQLLGPGEILDTRLAKPVYDYFSDATDPPTVDGFVSYLNQSSEAIDDGVILDISSRGYDAASDAIRFSVDLAASQTGVVRIGTADLTEELGAVEAFEVESSYLSEIKFNFDFGIDTNIENEGFFVEFEALTADLVITADSITSEPGGPLSEGKFQIVDGQAAIEIHAEVAFDNAESGDGRMGLFELQSVTAETVNDLLSVSATGTLIAALVLQGKGAGDADHLPTILVDAASDDIFSDGSLNVTTRYDVGSLRNDLLELFESFDATWETFIGLDEFNTRFPVIDAGIDELIATATGEGTGQVVDRYTPALAYFELLDVFNTDVSEIQTTIGNLPVIDIPDFDVGTDAHRLKLKSHLEQTFNISISPDWDVALYLPEIWSLFNPDFQIDDYLPAFGVLLGVPYVPVMDNVRSDIKSYFGSFPSLTGLVEYIQAAGQKSIFNGFSGQQSSEPFAFRGGICLTATPFNLISWLMRPARSTLR